MAENVMSGACDVVAPEELDGLRADGWRVIDVRSASEHAAGSIPGSENLPVDELRDHLQTLHGARVVVYCQVGQRGHTATSLLHEMGITARNLDGGYLTWTAAEAAKVNKKG
jgi:hypothetical protein